MEMNIWCPTNDSGEVEEAADKIITSISHVSSDSDYRGALITYCLSCGHPIELYDQIYQRRRVRSDGQIRHFFHRPSKAYTTGNRKRRRIHMGKNTEGETRWHKTGKTRPILSGGKEDESFFADQFIKMQEENS
ncbi:hypothetical protein CRG98_040715 [Punica granatum]|uniref:Uncharacterized protein n=1 Tax=Punica granatum TaxID=22663 RepID=A0A2I0I4K2_PUNGR|nr:hypothetical protein CRG98_040715 [Punica granatum]